MKISELIEIAEKIHRPGMERKEFMVRLTMALNGFQGIAGWKIRAAIKHVEGTERVKSEKAGIRAENQRFADAARKRRM